MRDYSRYKEIGKTKNTIVYTTETDPDILIIVPPEGTVDSVEDAQQNVDFLNNYARTLGKKCGSLVVMTNLVSQDAETRRVYSEMDTHLYYAAALVVENALSRALGSFFIGLSRPKIPTKLFNSVEQGIDWIKMMRSV